MEPFTICYTFTFPDSTKEIHELHINPKTLLLEGYAPDNLPDWTRLGFHQCPHTDFLKPMARFHLPLANPEETTYRAASMYLLAQYFRKKKNLETDLQMTGLKEIYNNLHGINVFIANRIRDVHEGDSPVNAITILDYFAHTIPEIIDDCLNEMDYLFTSYTKKLTRG